MFIDAANNNVALFRINHFNKSWFYLIFLYILKSTCGLYDKQSDIQSIVPLVDDFVGVDSKE